jgi:hypothetical protein
MTSEAVMRAATEAARSQWLPGIRSGPRFEGGRTLRGVEQAQWAADGLRG